MFKSRHITSKDILDDAKLLTIVFASLTIIGLYIMPFDISFATVIIVTASIIGVLGIILSVSYHGRLSRETMAKMLGKNFMDFCVCKFCENQRKISDAQRIL